jgi:hypothetical protein
LLLSTSIHIYLLKSSTLRRKYLLPLEVPGLIGQQRTPWSRTCFICM